MVSRITRHVSIIVLAVLIPVAACATVIYEWVPRGNLTLPWHVPGEGMIAFESVDSTPEDFIGAVVSDFYFKLTDDIEIALADIEPLTVDAAAGILEFSAAFQRPGLDVQLDAKAIPFEIAIVDAFCNPWGTGLCATSGAATAATALGRWELKSVTNVPTPTALALALAALGLGGLGMRVLGWLLR